MSTVSDDFPAEWVVQVMNEVATCAHCTQWNVVDERLFWCGDGDPGDWIGQYRAMGNHPLPECLAFLQQMAAANTDFVDYRWRLLNTRSGDLILAEVLALGY